MATSTVTVPNVVGKRVEVAAIPALRAAGLNYRTSQTIRAACEYTVNSQTPGAGKKVARGSTVDLGVGVVAGSCPPVTTSKAPAPASSSTEPAATAPAPSTTTTSTTGTTPASSTTTPASSSTTGTTGTSPATGTGATGGGGGGTGGGYGGSGGGYYGSSGSYGGAANTSASTAAPDNATQQAAASEDQTDWVSFFSSGGQPWQYPTNPGGAIAAGGSTGSTTTAGESS